MCTHSLLSVLGHPLRWTGIGAAGGLDPWKAVGALPPFYRRRLGSPWLLILGK